MGRWSRALAPRFVEWARVERGARVADVGCGTGALTAALLAGGAGRVAGFDLSPEFVAQARKASHDPRATFAAADAMALPEADGTFDAAFSGLTLNFVPDADKAAAEMVRVTREGGQVGAYLWDLAERMEMLRHFWDAAIEVDPARARPLDEGPRYPLCKPGPLEAMAKRAGLVDVTTGSLDLPMRFADFDDYWVPFLGGQGPSGSYLRSLAAPERERIQAVLRARLDRGKGNPVTMTARAWAVKGRVARKGR